MPSLRENFRDKEVARKERERERENKERSRTKKAELGRKRK